MKIPNPTTGDLSLYFHIPFCKKKCPYCHFFVLKNESDSQNILYKSLLKEIKTKLSKFEKKNIVSIYFGGGTPFIFHPKYFEGIFKLLYSSSATIDVDCEITIEANPEDISLSSVKALQNIGFNRFSLGVQSFDDILLKKLGRSHSASKTFQSINTVYQAGIENISIDLMYDIPGQNIKSWENTLSYVKDLSITHLSLYNLTLEPNTVFFRKKNKIIPELPSNKDSFQMLQSAIETFQLSGLNRYEISAFAKKRFYSVHNTGYWLYRSCLGFGPSAFSYDNQVRYRNIANFPKYCSSLAENKSPVDFIDRLDKCAQTNEALIIQLRLLQGLDLDYFQKTFGSLAKDTLQKVQTLVQNGLLRLDQKNLRLTNQGLNFYDMVATELI